MREEEVRLFFQKGNALFERNWSYAWKLHTIKNSPVRDSIKVTLLPKFKRGRSASTLGGWHIGISKYSNLKEDAWKFVKYVTSFSTQKRLIMDLGWSPARSDIYDDAEVYKKIPHIKILKAALENVIARPNMPYYPNISEIIQRYVNSALSNKLTPQEALRRAQREIDKIMNMYVK
jgi:multiple sugar transport system substrate-binding protein